MRSAAVELGHRGVVLTYQRVTSYGSHAQDACLLMLCVCCRFCHGKALTASCWTLPSAPAGQCVVSVQRGAPAHASIGRTVPQGVSMAGPTIRNPSFS